MPDATWLRLPSGPGGMLASAHDAQLASPAAAAMAQQVRLLSPSVLQEKMSGCPMY
jgi:hypothetical protein